MARDFDVTLAYTTYVRVGVVTALDAEQATMLATRCVGMPDDAYCRYAGELLFNMRRSPDHDVVEEVKR